MSTLDTHLASKLQLKSTEYTFNFLKEEPLSTEETTFSGCEDNGILDEDLPDLSKATSSFTEATALGSPQGSKSISMGMKYHWETTEKFSPYLLCGQPPSSNYSQYRSSQSCTSASLWKTPTKAPKEDNYDNEFSNILKKITKNPIHKEIKSSSKMSFKLDELKKKRKEDLLTSLRKYPSTL